MKNPFVLNTPEQIHIKSCGCGVVQLNLGITTVRVDRKVALELTKQLIGQLEVNKKISSPNLSVIK